jgi:hypothetical protein
MKYLKILMFLCMSLYFGCASAPDMVSEKKSADEKYSADEVRRMTVAQPFLISGDYFREREQQPNIVIGKSEVQTPKTVQPAQLPEAAPEPEKIASSGILPIKIGFLLSQTVSESSVAAIYSAIPEYAKSLMVGHEEITDALQNTDCLKHNDPRCISEKLGLYPGVRMLIMIERFDIPENFAGNAAAKLSIIDTGIHFGYPLIESGKHIKNKDDLAEFIQETLRNAIAYAVKKSEIIPAYCRAFSSENGKIFITAGKLSGLKPGDQLNIFSQGQLVKSPVGMPAGWIQGKHKGIVKVETLFGKDFAACSLISGDMPISQDMITE